MREFITNPRSDPVLFAKRYGWRVAQNGLMDVARANIGDYSLKPFHVGLTTSQGDFELITKRMALVSKLLVLSHGQDAPYCEVRVTGDRYDGDIGPLDLDAEPTGIRTHVGIHCPDLEALGKWLLRAERLMREGLLFYLPYYSQIRSDPYHENANPMPEPSPLDGVSYTLRRGSLIDPDESNPDTTQLIRLILDIDIPFIEGVSLDDFSKITVGEFDSYRRFQNFLQRRLLDVDEALNAIQTERQLLKVRLEIEDGIRAVAAEIKNARKRRAMAAAGAVASSVSAMLIAVNDGVIDQVLPLLGLTNAGTFWGAIVAATENNKRTVQGGHWYYVWVLARQSRTL
ncbi:hypothetical protein [Streptomyces sp. NPDC087300]|uniref:hypothetical protein n=1 Tax=Streptomyces sp. NPDC087300 TaxID=3365780 RepID=UPI0038025D2A